MRPIIVLLILVLFVPQLWASEAEYVAEDPVLEAKVMDISEELRCLVCQNQTIADSNAPLALDLRREVRDMVKQGMEFPEGIPDDDDGSEEDGGARA